MAVGEKKEVLACAIHVKRGNVAEHLEVQRDKILRAAQRASRMTRVDSMHHSQDVDSNLGSNYLELLHVLFKRILIIVVLSLIRNGLR